MSLKRVKSIDHDSPLLDETVLAVIEAECGRCSVPTTFGAGSDDFGLTWLSVSKPSAQHT